MQLPNWIKIIEGSINPLSCHCFVINGHQFTWIYDAGASQKALEEINSIDNNKNLILSHFHQDHITNALMIKNAVIYQGDCTYKHTNTGKIINSEITISDGFNFRLFPIPNTHAKGSVALEVNNYLFLGDSTAPACKKGRYFYNVTLLKSQIDVLKKCNAEYCILSHREEFICKKTDIIRQLEEIYSKRNPQEAFIYLN